MYVMPYRKKKMLESVNTFAFLHKIRSYQTVPLPSIIDYNALATISHVNQFQYPKYQIGAHSFTHKQFNIIAKEVEKLIKFLLETHVKWKNYVALIRELLQCQNTFYEKQRFPISLEIKDNNLKSFLISKVYKLSETYQM